jgi:hypothetical protein
MTDTRYSRPIAAVADVRPETPPARPTQVTFALWLLIGNFLVGFGRVGEFYERGDLSALVSVVMSVAVYAFLLFKLAT